MPAGPMTPAAWDYIRMSWFREVLVGRSRGTVAAAEAFGLTVGISMYRGFAERPL